MAELYRIGLFDDHPIITDGLKSLLSKSGKFSVAVVANTKEKLIELLKITTLDALLLDVIAPDVTGLDLLKTIRASYPSLKVIAYTTLSSPILIENLLMNGASGYINKRQPPIEVKEAILQVCKETKYVPAEYDFLLKGITLSPNPVNLTPRENEVLRLVLDGKMSKEIATLLDISQNTVENHRTNLFKKFDVSNLAELFKQAARMGYLKD